MPGTCGLRKPTILGRGKEQFQPESRVRWRYTIETIVFAKWIALAMYRRSQPNFVAEVHTANSVRAFPQWLVVSWWFVVSRWFVARASSRHSSVSQVRTVSGLAKQYFDVPSDLLGADVQDVSA